MTVEELLKHNQIAVNIQDDEGYTPLFSATIVNKIENFSALLSKAETDPNKQNKILKAPIHVAIQENYMEILTLLINNPKCNINIRDQENAFS